MLEMLVWKALRMLEEAIRRTLQEPSAFAAALIKQILHIGTDLYTLCGIQIPASNLVLSKAYVQKFTKYISMDDLIKIGASAKIADSINALICAMHFLFHRKVRPMKQKRSAWIALRR